MADFFATESVLKLSFARENVESEKSFSLPRALIPRFFLTWAESGLTELTFTVGKIRETFLPNNLLLLDSHRTRIESKLAGGQQLVEHSGTLRIIFDKMSRIQFMEITFVRYQFFTNINCEVMFPLPLQDGFDSSVIMFLELAGLVQGN